jgi:hypothetical protein
MLPDSGLSVEACGQDAKSKKGSHVAVEGSRHLPAPIPHSLDVVEFEKVIA